MNSIRKKLLLIGGGGHCKSILDTLYRCDYYQEIGIIDQVNCTTKKVLDTNIIGTDEDLPDLIKAGYTDAFISLGSVGNPAIRIELFHKILTLGFDIPNIIDSTAYVSAYCRLGTGIFVGKNAVINADVDIMDAAIINTNAVIEHDCKIGAFVHIAPSATICGNVSVGDNTHIGAKATLIQGVHIGKNVLIGAGSVVINSIQESQKFCGVPAKKM